MYSLTVLDMHIVTMPYIYTLTLPVALPHIYILTAPHTLTAPHIYTLTAPRMYTLTAPHTLTPHPSYHQHLPPPHLTPLLIQLHFDLSALILLPSSCSSTRTSRNLT